ncbi:MAG TPA: hypothetical protein VNJ53_02595 [Gaiellaceae bacterium]|nr:hypothetical protein [Gaiellaceae bacterium]
MAVGALVGLAGGWWLGGGGEASEPATVTVTETVPGQEPVLPLPVQETRDALLRAAESADYEALRPLVPEKGFSYTFGGEVAGGPLAYWRRLERTTGERPLDLLAAILRMPYVLAGGIYVWPWAYAVESPEQLSDHGRSLLAPIGPLERLFSPGTGYLGWRAGIYPDGRWAFFVAGD